MMMQFKLPRKENVYAISSIGIRNKNFPLILSALFWICCFTVGYFVALHAEEQFTFLNIEGTSTLKTLRKCHLPSVQLCFPEYTNEMAAEAIRPTTWTCGNGHNDTSDPYDIFSFVHIFKASGSTIRNFFEEYALACRKTWLCLSHGKQHPQQGRNWRPCGRNYFTDGRTVAKDRNKRFVHINNKLLRGINIFGGHIRIGSGDYLSNITSTQTRKVNIRHVVFLRDPKHRYVSARLYMAKERRKRTKDKKFETLHEVVMKIKTQVRDARSNNEYYLRSDPYLLTPDQKIMHDQYKKEEDETAQVEAKVRMMVENLVKYNAIIGMTEDMPGSMRILQHALISNRTARDVRTQVTKVFDQYTPIQKMMISGNETATTSILRGTTLNPSAYKNVSTSSVLQALAQDKEFDDIFTEYCKYEQMLTDFAWHIHNMQYDALAGQLQ